MMPIRVGVLGAGAAGLCCARHLLAQPELFSCLVFEQASQLGGTWLYTELTGTDHRGVPIHPSMYENLKTNLPKEVMAFPDFEFPASWPSFIHHSQVQEYLLSYANHFNINKCIQFDTRVTKIFPSTASGTASKTLWKVTTEKVDSSDEQIHEFDSVLICNGHYALPRIPAINNVEIFSGKVLHSHDYRVPKQFLNQTVAILGASASGQDIAIDISSYAKKIYLSHNIAEPIHSKLPDNVIQVPGIHSANLHGFNLRNGQTIQVDSLIYCTGYIYSFPFLSSECGISVEGNHVTPLYKHIINIKYPTMGFIGVPFIVVPFLVSHYQVLFFLKSLLCEGLLPSPEAMRIDAETELMERLGLGMPLRYAHKFGPRQWPYINDLARMANIPRAPQVLEKIYNHVHQIRKENLLEYRHLMYRITNDEHFSCRSSKEVEHL